MAHLFFSFLLMVVLLLFSPSAYSQADTKFSRFGSWMVGDPISFVSHVNEHHLIAAGFVTIGMATLGQYDHSSSIAFQRRFRDSDVLKFPNRIGNDMYAMQWSAAIFGTTLLFKDPKLQDAAFTSFQSVIYSNLSTSLGKFIFSRARPEDNEGASDFDFFSGNHTSFPSGHTATAFALVTPWIMYYPSIVTYPLLALPVGTAIARVSRGKHWMTDVTAGAIIGGYWGIFLSKRHQNKQSAKRGEVEIFPTLSPGSVGFSLNYRF